MLFYCILRLERKFPLNFSLKSKTPRMLHPGRFGVCLALNIKFEVVLCVVVRDIFYNLGENVVILGELSVFHPVAEQIAEDTPEVFMSGVGQEAPGVCQHSYKTGKISEVGKGNHLVLHACLVVIEPPCAALLNFCYSGGILEAAQNGSDGLIVIGI